MVDRKLRHTLSAAAWLGAFLCALALLTSAMALAGADSVSAAHVGQP